MIADKKKSSRRSKLDIARDTHEQARLEYETARFRRGTEVMNKWDAVEPNRHRTPAKIETKNEDKIFDATRRLKGCNLGRNLERNYSPGKSMLHQMRVNVVGALGKLKINLPGGEEGAEYFNEVFAKDCDFRDDIHWSTMCQNVLVSPIREGDMLGVVDNGVIEDTGKIITWEADQIVAVSKDVLGEKGYDPKDHTQENGIIRDKWGRILAYCVTGDHGSKIVNDPDKVTVLKRGVARLVKNPWRLNQGRGTPSLLTPSTNLIDLYEILASELQTSKRAAKLFATVKRTDSSTDWDGPAANPEYLPENDGRTAEEVATDGANQATHTARNYEILEAYTGGHTEYMDKEDELDIPDVKHPNKDMAAFVEAVHGMSGSALGLARAYTILRADSSYTSFRGDMILSWVTFYWLQKHLERTWADWVAKNVLEWALRKGEVKSLPDGWQRKISWKWPVMPEVDELDAQNAIAAALKNGTTDYSELLGPDWEKHFESLAAQFEKAKALGLPLGAFETKSGGMSNPKKDGAVTGAGNA